MSPYAFGRWSEGSMRVLAEFQINLAIPNELMVMFQPGGGDKYIGELLT